MALDRFRKLADCLSEKHDSGCDCEAAYKQFECLAEQAVAGVDIHDILPRVAMHLDQCSDCREEYEALVAIVRAEREHHINE
ncbi:MAG: hypothetical protein K8J31_16410 [Anaerolineae bacterium]|nr:hypothetical protein [Anaerolineae bacterium]